MNDGDIDHIMELVMDNDQERAIGALWMLKERLRLDRVAAKGDPLIAFARAEVNRMTQGMNANLPPMEPLRARRSPTIEVACPTCKAKAGKPCLKMSHGGGANARVLDPPQAKDGYHSQRAAKAKS